MSEETLPDRVCKRGHLVSLASRTGKLTRSAGKPYLRCVPCEQLYERDLARAGMQRRRR